MDPLSDHNEFGRRLSAARGYMRLDREKFAPKIDFSVPTIRRYESGEGLKSKSLLERRQLAERYQEVTGCPASLLYGDDPPASAVAEERLSRIEAVVTALNETQASMRERLAELDVPDDSRQAPASAPRRAGQGRAGTKR